MKSLNKYGTYQSTYQRTFYLDDGRKVQIKTRRIYHGWIVNINGKDYPMRNRIDPESAEDRAYVKWVNDQEMAA